MAAKADPAIPDPASDAAQQQGDPVTLLCKLREANIKVLVNLFDTVLQKALAAPTAEARVYEMKIMTELIPKAFQVMCNNNGSSALLSKESFSQLNFLGQLHVIQWQGQSNLLNVKGAVELFSVVAKCGAGVTEEQRAQVIGPCLAMMETIFKSLGDESVLK